MLDYQASQLDLVQYRISIILIGGVKLEGFQQKVSYMHERASSIGSLTFRIRLHKIIDDFYFGLRFLFSCDKDRRTRQFHLFPQPVSPLSQHRRIIVIDRDEYISTHPLVNLNMTKVYSDAFCRVISYITSMMSRCDVSTFPLVLLYVPCNERKKKSLKKKKKQVIRWAVLLRRKHSQAQVERICSLVYYCNVQEGNQGLVALIKTRVAMHDMGYHHVEREREEGKGSRSGILLGEYHSSITWILCGHAENEVCWLRDLCRLLSLISRSPALCIRFFMESWWRWVRQRQPRWEEEEAEREGYRPERRERRRSQLPGGRTGLEEWREATGTRSSGHPRIILPAIQLHDCPFSASHYPPILRTYSCKHG